MTNPLSSRRELSNGLTIEEYKVALAFLKDPNMSNAALWQKAMPWSKANDQTANRNVQEIMERPRVKAWLEAEQRQLFDASTQEIAEVDKRQFQIATATFTECLDENGVLMPPSKWPERARGAVKSLTVNRRPDGGETLRLEMHNPTESAKVVYMRRGLIKQPDVKGGDTYNFTKQEVLVIGLLGDSEARRALDVLAERLEGQSGSNGG